MSKQARVPNLMDEYPLLVYPSLAKAMGINKAIVFQQLHFLLCNQKTAKNEYVFVDGKWWVYNTYEEWQEGYFNWLSEVTLKRIFIELEKGGLVISRQSVKNKSDRRKWYSINYELWNKIKNTLEPSDQNDTMVDEIILIPSNVSKRADGYSETTSDTSTKNITSAEAKVPKSDLDAQYDAIAEVWGTTANGTIVSMRGMIFGSTKTRGQWKLCQFEPPATIDELKCFAPYMEVRMKDKKLTDKPTTPVVIQRWFYDYRASKQAPAYVRSPELAGITEIIR